MKSYLHWAVRGDNEAGAALVLDHGARVDAADDSGSTPLVWAAHNNQRGMVRLLLDRGADVNAADSMGRTALIWATLRDLYVVVVVVVATHTNMLSLLYVNNQ